MSQIKKHTDKEFLRLLKNLPDEKKTEVLDFLEYLLQRSESGKLSPNKPDLKTAVSAVERTWGSINLNKSILQFIAEDKELEYDVR